MSFEQPLKLEAYYLKKEKCDKLQSYIKSEANGSFTFQGNITPHGHYDVRISYDSKKKCLCQKLKNTIKIY